MNSIILIMTVYCVAITFFSYHPVYCVICDACRHATRRV